MMSYKNKSIRILFPLFAAAILLATLFLQAAHAANSVAQAPEYAVKYDNWKAAQFASQNHLQEAAEGKPLTYSGDMTWFYANQFAQVQQVEAAEVEVDYSNALALQYVSRFEPALLNQVGIEYSNDLALFYANANQFGKAEADEAKVDYSDALALQYISRFEPALLDQMNIEYSNDLALSYANANQFAQVETNEAKVDYSDALALQYASRFQPALLDEIDTVQYSDALALFYANANQFAQIEADEAKVDYSDALALQYASRFEPALLDEIDTVQYSNALALSYASRYGNFTTESITAHNPTDR